MAWYNQSSSTPTVTVSDSLLNSSTSEALSANQGRVLNNKIEGLGDITVVADNTALAALTDLDVGDIVHVEDADGNGNWIRYQVTAVTTGTWGTSSSTIIGTEQKFKGITMSALDPSVNDDADLGYIVGSLWFNVSTNKLHVAESVGNGTALWTQLGGAKVGTGTVDATITENFAAGYEIGSLWINTTTTNPVVQVCVGDGVWNRVDNVVRNFNAIVDPTGSDDNTLGYEVDSTWTNQTTQTKFICITASPTGSAVWKRLDNAKNKVSAIDPVLADNFASGYEVGSIWINTTIPVKVFTCTADGIWDRTDNVQNGVSNIDPTITDNFAAGYEVGSLWIRTSATNAIVYVCAGDGIWNRVDNFARNFGATVDPTVNDDNTLGYETHSTWTNQTAGTSWIAHTSGTGNAKWKRISNVLDNNTAIVDPTATDDAGDGYEAGSSWFNTASNKSFICTSSAVGAASWVKVTSGVKNNVIAAAPTATDDSTQEYSVGSLWFDTTLAPLKPTVYVATDVTVATAVWSVFTGERNNVDNVDPTSTNAGNEGYQIGSLWFNNASKKTFMATAIAPLVATWNEIGQPIVTTFNPSASSDAGNGYSIGTVWINSNTNTAYISTDDSAGTAVWEPITGPNAVTYSTANTNLTGSKDHIAYISTSGGPLAYILPLTGINGQKLTVIKSSADADFIDIDTASIKLQNDSAVFQYDGTAWRLIKAPQVPLVGSTAIADGSIGYVPKPLISDVGKYLNADGTWKKPGYSLAGEKTAPYTANVFEYVPVNTTAGAITITAPASPVAGDEFVIIDSRATSGSNNITVDFGATSFHGVAGDDYVINENRATVKFLYIDSTTGFVKVS